jgi:hypothetical protein
MAQLRLVAVTAATMALAACRASEAGPTSGLAPPAHWRALPSLAAAATNAAKQARTSVDGAEAWGEPTRGCYAVWLALRSASGTPDVLADLVVRSLTSDPMLAGFVVANVVKPAAGVDSGVLSFSFTRPPYRGTLRAQIGRTGFYAVLACFWNVREPVACQAACTSLVGSMK